jgi:hypothetical protein
MGRVKSAFEKAMEKVQGIEGLTPAEKEEMKERDRIRGVISAFHKDEIKKDAIWEQLKGANPALLKEAELTMFESLRLTNTEEEFNRRRDGIMALEISREGRNTAALESVLNAADKLRKEYRDVQGKAVEQLRTAIEQNPRLRARPVRTPDGRTVLQASMTVDEAVQEKLSEYIAEQARRYDAMFAQAIERLKQELK